METDGRRGHMPAHYHHLGKVGGHTCRGSSCTCDPLRAAASIASMSRQLLGAQVLQAPAVAPHEDKLLTP